MQKSHRLNRFALLFVCVCTLYVLNISNVNSQTNDPPTTHLSFTSDPIAYTGHGALFDANGNQIDVTIAFIEGVQNYYLETLLQQANAEQQIQFTALRSGLQNEQSADRQTVVIANTLLLDWLIPTVHPADATVLLQKNRMLRQQIQWLQAANGGWNDEQFETLEALARTLAPLPSQPTSDFIGSASVSTDKGGQAYIDECREAEVPIPPDWGSNQWQNRGILGNEFISTDLDAEVYTYSNAAGVCIALPRSSGNTITLLGIICQGKSTGNACFWDNQQNRVGFDIPKGSNVRLTDFAGGADLLGGTGGVCTQCHAGENVYIIHPNTALGKPELNDLELIPDRWHTPLVADEWPQNPGPTNVLDNVSSAGECTSCHTREGQGGRFPDLSTALSGYCAAVLRPAVGLQAGTTATMPNGASYQAHIDALLVACNRSPRLAIVYVDDTAIGAGQGTLANPFRTVAEGVDAVASNGVINIVPGFYAETAATTGNLTFTIDKRMTLQSTGGPVYIGRGGNTAPQATNDTYTVQAPETTVLRVLDNDSDTDGDPLRITIVMQSANGTATVSGTTIRYTPNEGYAGADSLTYRITDGFGGSDTATVNLTVLAAPQPELTLSLSALSLIAEAGASPPDQPINITNSGTGTLNWTAAESIPWLSLSATVGTAPSTITVSIDSSDLAAGDYTGEILITAGTQSKTITVNLQVESELTPATNTIYLPVIVR